MAEDYQFDDLDTTTSSESVSSEESSGCTSMGASIGNTGGSTTSSGGNGNGNGYASELFSKQIKAKFRTFFIDLKESSNGKFIKISEKSHGRKSTIMMDAEDIPVFIEALQEVSTHL